MAREMRSSLGLLARGGDQPGRYADAFHLVAKLEMDVVRTCADALLLEPTAEAYAPRQLAYASCCAAVVAGAAAVNESELPGAGGLGRMRNGWPGCACKRSERCTPFGSLYFMPVRRSVYSAQLRPWLARFGADAVHAVFNEELEAHPIETLRAITAHAVGALRLTGGPKAPQPTPTKALAFAWNETVVEHTSLNRSRTYNAMHARTAAQLRCFFAPYNCELGKLLGRPLPSAWGADACASPPASCRHADTRT
jgi:hypothetical protein